MIETVTSHNRFIKFYTDDKFSKNQVRFSPSNDMTVFDPFDFLTPDDVYLDVGAAIGLYSLLAGLKCRVLAIEPYSVNHANLVRNISLNNLNSTVFPFKVAFSDTTGSTSLFFSDDQTGYGQCPSILDYHHESSATVPCYRADDFLATKPTPTVVKIDTEGSEMLILQGMPNLLQSVRRIYIEIHLWRYKAKPMEVVKTFASLLTSFSLSTKVKRGTTEMLTIWDRK